jgi:hypothetical protein
MKKSEKTEKDVFFIKNHASWSGLAFNHCQVSTNASGPAVANVIVQFLQILYCNLQSD